MKAYLVTSDGESEVILAPSFTEAIYETIRLIRLENNDDTYDESIIDQVVLLGEVKNWPAQMVDDIPSPGKIDMKLADPPALED